MAFVKETTKRLSDVQFCIKPGETVIRALQLSEPPLFERYVRTANNYVVRFTIAIVVRLHRRTL